MPSSAEQMMNEDQPMVRRHYESSGEVNGLRFVLALPITSLGVVALAAAMCGMWYSGWYFMFYVAILAGLLLGAVVSWTVSIGHCRNRWLAATLGVIAGIFTYCGSYHFDMLTNLGPKHALRFDSFARSVAQRLQTDVWGDPVRNRFQQRKAPTPFLNYLVFGLELSLIAGFGAGLGVMSAGRVFCEDNQRWAVRRSFKTDFGSGAGVVNALRTGEWDLVPLFLNASTSRLARPPYCELAFEFCVGTEPETECCAFFSVREVPDPHQVRLRESLNPGQQYLVRQEELASAELAQLRARLPMFS